MSEFQELMKIHKQQINKMNNKMAIWWFILLVCAFSYAYQTGDYYSLLLFGAFACVINILDYSYSKVQSIMFMHMNEMMDQKEQIRRYHEHGLD